MGFAVSSQKARNFDLVSKGSMQLWSSASQEAGLGVGQLLPFLCWIIVLLCIRGRCVVRWVSCLSREASEHHLVLAEAEMASSGLLAPLSDSGVSVELRH